MDIVLHLNDKTAKKLMRKTGGEPEKALLPLAMKEAAVPATPVKREITIWKEREAVQNDYLALLSNYLKYANYNELQLIVTKFAEISRRSVAVQNELKAYAASHESEEIRTEMNKLLHKRKIGEDLLALDRLAVYCEQIIPWSELMERQGYTYCPYCGEYHAIKKHENGTFYCSYANKNFSAVEARKTQQAKRWTAKTH